MIIWLRLEQACLHAADLRDVQMLHLCWWYCVLSTQGHPAIRQVRHFSRLLGHGIGLVTENCVWASDIGDTVFGNCILCCWVLGVIKYLHIQLFNWLLLRCFYIKHRAGPSELIFIKMTCLDKLSMISKPKQNWIFFFRLKVGLLVVIKRILICSCIQYRGSWDDLNRLFSIFRRFLVKSITAFSYRVHLLLEVVKIWIGILFFMYLWEEQGIFEADSIDLHHGRFIIQLLRISGLILPASWDSRVLIALIGLWIIVFRWFLLL